MGIIKKMQQFYQDAGDRKSFAYLRAIACIADYGKEIRSGEELKNIDGPGREMIEKVKEYLRAGTTKKIESTLNKKNAVPHKDLLRVYGIGSMKAAEFYHKGIRTVRYLKKNEQLLSKSQRIGLRYVNDFEVRIPGRRWAGCSSSCGRLFST